MEISSYQPLASNKRAIKRQSLGIFRRRAWRLALRQIAWRVSFSRLFTRTIKRITAVTRQFSATELRQQVSRGFGGVRCLLAWLRRTQVKAGVIGWLVLAASLPLEAMGGNGATSGNRAVSGNLVVGGNGASEFSSGDYLVGTVAELNGDLRAQLAAYNKLAKASELSQELLKKGFLVFILNQIPERVADEIYPHLTDANRSAEIRFVTAIVKYKRGEAGVGEILDMGEDTPKPLQILAALIAPEEANQLVRLEGLPVEAFLAERDNRYADATSLWRRYYLAQPSQIHRLIWYVQAQKRGGMEIEKITDEPELDFIYQIPPHSASPHRAVAMFMAELARLASADSYSAAIYASLGLYLEPHNKQLALLLGRNLYLAGLSNWGEQEIYPPLMAHQHKSTVWDKHLVVLYAHIEDTQAQQLYLGYLEDNPNEEMVLMQLGQLYSGQKRYEEAFSIYNRILSTDADNVDALYLRGVASERLGNWSEAQADFKKALAIDPDDPHISNYLAYSWLERGENLTQALAMLKHAYHNSTKGDNGYIADSYGWALYKNGKPAEAVEFLQEALNELPNDAVVNEHLGDVLRALGKNNLARLSYHRALQNQPEPEAAERINSKLESL